MSGGCGDQDATWPPGVNEAQCSCGSAAGVDAQGEVNRGWLVFQKARQEGNQKSDLVHRASRVRATWKEVAWLSEKNIKAKTDSRAKATRQRVW